MEKKHQLVGLIPPVVTPFKANGAVDEDRFRKEVARIVACGVHGISVGGSTGEGAFLEDGELASLLKIAKSLAPRLPLVAGIIRPSTQHAVRTALFARDSGADALMLTPTYYNILVPDEEGNRLFYQTLADAARLPIIIYNVIPQTEVSAAAVGRLLDIPEVVGIKQSLGGIMACYDMVQTNGRRGLIYSATDEMMFSTFELGADGAISAILALFPRLCLEMWNLAKAGRHAEGLAVQNRLYPLWKALRGPQFPARMKAIMRLADIDVGLPRSPLHDVDEETRTILKNFVESVGRDAF